MTGCRARERFSGAVGALTATVRPGCHTLMAAQRPFENPGNSHRTTSWECTIRWWDASSLHRAARGPTGREPVASAGAGLAIGRRLGGGEDLAQDRLRHDSGQHRTLWRLLVRFTYETAPAKQEIVLARAV